MFGSRSFPHASQLTSRDDILQFLRHEAEYPLVCQSPLRGTADDPIVILAFDVDSGRIVWGMEASSYHGLVRGFGNIYYCDDRSRIIAVRDNSNDIVWENEDLEFRSITAPIAIGNYVAVADFEGYIHLISQIDNWCESDATKKALIENSIRAFGF